MEIKDKCLTADHITYLFAMVPGSPSSPTPLTGDVQYKAKSCTVMCSQQDGAFIFVDSFEQAAMNASNSIYDYIEADCDHTSIWQNKHAVYSLCKAVSRLMNK